ncbi:MAG: DUF885 domain-containing protein [Angelakisella sp.]|nr:DUF885 domain-containing protein [Angelakisella sp.]
MNWKTRGLAIFCAVAMTMCSACGQSGQGESGQNSYPSSEAMRPKTQPELFADFTHQLFEEAVTQDGISQHFFVANPATLGGKGSPNLGRFDLESLLEYEEEVRDNYARLSTFGYGALTAEQQQTYAILKDVYELEMEAEGLALFASHNTLNNGNLTTLPQLLADFRIQSEQDIEDYLMLLEDFPRCLEEGMSLEYARAEAGMFMPELILDKVLEAGRGLLSNPEESFMITSFEERLNALPNLAASKKAKYLEKNRTLWLKKAVPAGEKLLEDLESLRETCSPAQGLWQYEKGKDYYAYFLKATTGLDISPEEATVLLEDAVEDNIGLLLQIVYTDTKAVEEIGGDNSKNLELDTPEKILEWLRSKSSDEFEPIKDISYQVKRVPDSLKESSAPAYFLRPPVDAPSHNYIYINDKYKSQVEGRALVETLAHEGYPGHMYQNNYFISKQPDKLRCILSFKGYSEGWANYCDSQVYSWLGYGRNASALLRCDDAINSLLSARIDIGVNYEGWDEQKIGEYLGELGLNVAAAREVFTGVLSDPGNSLAYALGELEFERLRSATQQRLGTQFDAKAFHQVILDCGPAPFNFVEAKINDYVESVLDKGTAAAKAA